MAQNKELDLNLNAPNPIFPIQSVETRGNGKKLQARRRIQLKGLPFPIDLWVVPFARATLTCTFIRLPTGCSGGDGGSRPLSGIEEEGGSPIRFQQHQAETRTHRMSLTNLYHMPRTKNRGQGTIPSACGRASCHHEPRSPPIGC